MFKENKKMILIALIDAFASQIYMQIFPQGFPISLSVAILPIYYFFDRKLNPRITAVYIGAIGLTFRTITRFAYYGGFAKAFLADFNFIYFDISYGLFFYYLYTKKIDLNNGKSNLTTWVGVVIFSDFMGNCIEYLSRYGLKDFVTTTAIGTLLLVAVIRAILGTAIVLLIRYYRMLIKKQEHEARYQQLLLLSSDLKSEIYYMRNNMEHIENVMTDAFYLYDKMEEIKTVDKKEKALSIAKDIHEIKKNYYRVIQGIEGIATDDSNDDSIKISDLTMILYTSMNKTIASNDYDIGLSFYVKSGEYIKDHYYLMSVLRNIVNNSIEAMSKQECKGIVTLIHREDEDEHVFIIKDNGPGIKEKDLKFVFDPGFSTKFNEATGSISRGIGLTLVKEIVERQFGGSINIESIFGKGTTFRIKIPRVNLNA